MITLIQKRMAGRISLVGLFTHTCVRGYRSSYQATSSSSQVLYLDFGLERVESLAVSELLLLLLANLEAVALQVAQPVFVAVGNAVLDLSCKALVFFVILVLVLTFFSIFL